jgi:hypothetical protein
VGGFVAGGGVDAVHDGGEITGAEAGFGRVLGGRDLGGERNGRGGVRVAMGRW